MYCRRLKNGILVEASLHLSRLIRRIDRRIIPSCMIIHLLCFIDRSNIVSYLASISEEHSLLTIHVL